MPISLVELVACVPLLESVNASALDSLARAAAIQRYRPGEILFRAGDAPIDLIFILEGRVLVERRSPRRSHFLHSEARGGVLGEIPVFGREKYPATATTVEAVRSAHVRVAVIERLLSTEPSFGRFALQRLAARAGSLLRRIDDLTASTVTARLAAFILTRAEAARGQAFSLGKSQQAVAQELGTAREVVVRGIAALIAAGAVRRDGRSRLVVADASVLRAIASPRS